MRAFCATRGQNTICHPCSSVPFAGRMQTRRMLKTLLTTCLLVCSAVSIAWGQQRNALLTRARIWETEQRLAELGYWTGPVDGVFDVGSRQALIAFQKWEGRLVTAKLTGDELEALRRSEAPQPRDLGYEHVEVDIDRQ